MSGSTTRLVLIRHGESNVTVKRIVGGPRSCDGLSALGRRQAEALASRLTLSGELKPDVLVSSEYPRAIETADIIAPVLGFAIVERRAAFGEHDPGPDCDGVPYAAFTEQFGDIDWDGDPFRVGFPGGESIAVFQHRIGQATSDILAEHEGRSIVVVCHGGVVDAVFRRLMSTPSTGAFHLHTLNTSLTEFVKQDKKPWKLVRYNDSAHLAGLPAHT